jgi:hypothetical protein
VVGIYKNAVQIFNVTGCTALANLSCRFNQLTALDVSTCPVMANIACADNLLTSLLLGTSPSYMSVAAANNSLPASPNGVDAVIDALFANCLTNGGFMDLDTAATNATPSAPQQAKWATLQVNGWTGNIN